MSQKTRISFSQAIALQAPLAHGNQVDLEQLIAESHRKESERERFQAHAAHHISAAMKKERERRNRKNAAPENNGPTPERLAKLVKEDISAITPPIDSRLGVTTKAHIIRSPLETNREKIKERLYNVGKRFVKDFDAAELGGHKVTSSYEGTPGTAFGARHGGVQDIAREAKTRMMLMAAQIGPSAWELLVGLVGQVTNARTGHPPTISECGAWLAGYAAESDQARAAGVGALIACLGFVEAFYQRLDHDGGSMSAEEVRARRTIIREREEKAARRRAQQAPQKPVNNGVKEGRIWPDQSRKG